MFSPPDEVTGRRMRSAHARAAALLGWAPGQVTAWGWNGRTAGGAATRGGEYAWLRVLAVPLGKAGDKLWCGNELAACLIPARVPRPALINLAAWDSGDYSYRAELFEHVTAPFCSPSPVLDWPLRPANEWWAQLRTALDTVAATPPPPGREPVISQAWLTRSLPRFLGPLAEGLNPTPPAGWTTAHGDLHWANLTSGPLYILDWEGWGPAPAGFDVANLYAYTLLQPRTAALVEAVFGDILNSEAGRFARLTVAAMILQAAERDPLHARIAPAVRADAERLLTLAHR